MNPIGAGHAYSPTTVSTQAPIGKPPVGLEPAQNKTAALPPVEQSAAAEKARGDQASDSPKTTAVRSKSESDDSDKTPTSVADLDAEEIAQVRELAGISRKVHLHEAAHAAVGGALAGAKSFTYVTGPDGVRYAVAGEVSIEFGQSDDPALTLRNASQVRSAALAPADPSGQDLQVAAQAGQIMQQARQELAGVRDALLSKGASSSRANAAIQAFGQVRDDQDEKPPLLDQSA